MSSAANSSNASDKSSSDWADSLAYGSGSVLRWDSDPCPLSVAVAVPPERPSLVAAPPPVGSWDRHTHATDTASCVLLDRKSLRGYDTAHTLAFSRDAAPFALPQTWWDLWGPRLKCPTNSWLIDKQNNHAEIKSFPWLLRRRFDNKLRPRIDWRWLMISRGLRDTCSNFRIASVKEKEETMSNLHIVHLSEEWIECAEERREHDGWVELKINYIAKISMWLVRLLGVVG